MSDALERINTEVGNDEAWICACGNTAESDGFSPCNRDGRRVEPTPEDWFDDLYHCDRCGRIIDQATRAVVARASVPADEVRASIPSK